MTHRTLLRTAAALSLVASLVLPHAIAEPPADPAAAGGPVDAGVVVDLVGSPPGGLPDPQGALHAAVEGRWDGPHTGIDCKAFIGDGSQLDRDEWDSFQKVSSSHFSIGVDCEATSMAPHARLPPMNFAFSGVQVFCRYECVPVQRTYAGGGTGPVTGYVFNDHQEGPWGLPVKTSSIFPMGPIKVYEWNAEARDENVRGCYTDCNMGGYAWNVGQVTITMQQRDTAEWKLTSQKTTDKQWCRDIVKGTDVVSGPATVDQAAAMEPTFEYVCTALDGPYYIPPYVEGDPFGLGSVPVMGPKAEEVGKEANRKASTGRETACERTDQC